MTWMPECQNFLFKPYLSHLELNDIAKFQQLWIAKTMHVVDSRGNHTGDSKIHTYIFAYIYTHNRYIYIHIDMINLSICNTPVYMGSPTDWKKQLCKSLVAQTLWLLSSVGENIVPILSVLVFFPLLIIHLIWSWHTHFPGGCEHVTLEHFSFFKMAARMPEFLKNHIYLVL